MYAQTPGEELLEQYLLARCLPFEYERETDGVSPDYWVQHPDFGLIVMEVAEPELRLPRPAGSFSSFPAVRETIRRKGKQAGAVAALGVPFVLVLASTNSDLTYDANIIMGSMFGNLGVSFPVNIETGTGDPDQSKMVFTSGARLQPEMNTRFSAVASVSSFNPTLAAAEHEVHRRLQDVDHDDGAAMFTVISDTYDELTESGEFEPEHPGIARVRVCHNNLHAQFPLSLDAFGGPHDDQWAWIQDVGFTQATSGVQGALVPRSR